MESSFDDFSVEMGEYEVKKTKKFDRLWRITGGGSIDQHPLVYNDRVYFGCMNHNVYCLEAATGKLVWKFKAEDRIGVISSPIVHRGILYIGSYDRFMYALDAETGKLMWKFETQGEILSVAFADEDVVYFTSRDQHIYAVTWDKGKLLWRFKTQDEHQSSPTVFEDRVFFCSYDQNVYCLKKDTGEFIWKFYTQGELLNSPYFLIHDRNIYFGSMDGNTYAVNIDTGKMVWKRKLSNYGAMPVPAINSKKDVLYNCGRDGTLFAMTLEGKTIWKFRNNLIFGHPEVHDDKVYLTSEDHNMRCISSEGKLLWKFETDAPVWWKAAFWKDMVYFGSYDCHLYAINDKTQEVVWKFRCPGSPSWFPPLHEDFEVQMKVSKSDVEESGNEKRYDLSITEEEGDTNFYKSRITYQVSTQYAAKGKYQIDSLEEEF